MQQMYATAINKKRSHQCETQKECIWRIFLREQKRINNIINRRKNEDSFFYKMQSLRPIQKCQGLSTKKVFIVLSV